MANQTRIAPVAGEEIRVSIWVDIWVDQRLNLSRKYPGSQSSA
jgi:hypothetical protein